VRTRSEWPTGIALNAGYCHALSFPCLPRQHLPFGEFPTNTTKAAGYVETARIPSTAAVYNQLSDDEYSTYSKTDTRTDNATCSHAGLLRASANGAISYAYPLAREVSDDFLTASPPLGAPSIIATFVFLIGFLTTIRNFELLAIATAL
jgi:hypothetical protein